jgi:predicted anti-sigma-YlaC factor YlaD
MVSAPILPSVTFKSMGRDNRREVMRLAGAGKRHADPAIAAAVYRWSHAKRWNSLANRLPGWLLPCVGVVYILLVVLTGLPLWLAIGGTVVVVVGLLGWINTSGARSLRAVYVDESAEG